MSLQYHGQQCHHIAVLSKPLWVQVGLNLAWISCASAAHATPATLLFILALAPIKLVYVCVLELGITAVGMSVDVTLTVTVIA